MMTSVSIFRTCYQHISVGLSGFDEQSGHAPRSVFIVCCTALCVCTLRLELCSDVCETRTEVQHLQTL